VSKGEGKKCGEPALRAVLLGTQDKAANVREAGNALLAELVKVRGGGRTAVALCSQLLNWALLGSSCCLLFEGLAGVHFGGCLLWQDPTTDRNKYAFCMCRSWGGTH
jgi:hypothetical protein